MKKLFLIFVIFFVLAIKLVPLEAKASHNTRMVDVNSIESSTGEKPVATLAEANVVLYATEREGNLEKFRSHISSKIICIS